MVTKQAAGKIGELYVFNELLKRGATVYVPVVDEGIDALVRTPAGRIVELQIKGAGGAGSNYTEWFQVSNLDVRKNYFIVGVEFGNGAPASAWVFPSIIFDKYATGPSGRPSIRDLKLNEGIRKYGLVLRDLLCGFKDRWELITNYEKYEALLESPEDLEDLLTMRESLEAPEEEVIILQ